MECPSCQSAIDGDDEACFHCGMSLFALTRGTVLAGRYEILSPLGRGGMGRVYKAFDRVMDEHVAVKVLRGEYMRDAGMTRRFVSEIKLARRIGHRNVCRIHEYGEDGDIRFIVMELLSGVTLKEYLGNGPLPPEAAYDVSMQVARGLNAVHELGIVHRDFKTANIMIDALGVAKVVDFGIAKHVSASTSPTVTGVMMTPEYMSPEQIAGGPAGFHSDIYALGCVVYEVFTGGSPFRRSPAAASLRQQDDLLLEGEAAKRIPPALAPILKRALARDPSQRYESVADFFHALTAAAAAGGYTGVHRGGLHPRAGEPTGQAGWLHRPAPRSWRWTLAAMVILVAGLALLSQPRAPVPPATISVLSTPAPVASAVPFDIGGPPRPVPFEGVLVADPPSFLPVGPTVLTGTLRLLVAPEARVTVDGTPLGLVSARDVALAPGVHTVDIEHPDYRALQRRVTVREGATEHLVLDLAAQGVRR